MIQKKALQYDNSVKPAKQRERDYTFLYKF